MFVVIQASSWKYEYPASHIRGVISTKSFTFICEIHHKVDQYSLNRQRHSSTTHDLQELYDFTVEQGCPNQSLVPVLRHLNQLLWSSAEA